jgi:hypothetical protein
VINWAALAAIGSLFAIVATVIAASYTHGKLTQRVDSNEKQIGAIVGDAEIKFNKVFARFEHHDERIGEHDVKIGKIEEWKSGFSTGVKVTGNQSQ